MNEIIKPLSTRKHPLYSVRMIQKGKQNSESITSSNKLILTTTTQTFNNEAVIEHIPSKPIITTSSKHSSSEEINSVNKTTPEKNDLNPNVSGCTDLTNITGNNQNEVIEVICTSEPNVKAHTSCSNDDDDVNEILKYKLEILQKKDFSNSSLLKEELDFENTENNNTESVIVDDNDESVLNSENEDLLCIHIYRSDCLKMDHAIRHPCVVIHISDLENNGMYLKKSLPNKNVTYNQERSSFILPVMTRPFNFKDNRSLVPEWDEILTFNEATSHIIKPSTIFFFEIVDFIDSSHSETEFSSIGWRHIAWAFLKTSIIDVSSAENILRLQLYYVGSIPKTSISSKNDVPYIFKWYKSKRWKLYPSTLYVCLRSISFSNIDSKPQHRSCTPFQSEIGSDASVKSLALFSSNGENLGPDKNTEHLSALHRLNELEWNRLPGQSCKIPNTKIFIAHPNSKGCLAIKFSNSGLFLACGAFNDIFIYAIDGILEKRLSNHQGLIYTFCWYSDDSLLLSSSADCTTCIWDIKSRIKNPFQILPHPSFVYCCTFIFPEKIIVTGCYDGIVRIWHHNDNSSKMWQLHQELTGHKGYINAVCSFENKEFFTGDSIGIIIHWSFDAYGRWQKKNVVKPLEIYGTVINKLIVFPGNKRLLIHTRDSLLRAMDIKTSVVIQWYQGGLNETLQCNSVITPCGSLLFSVCEDGTINVWETNTGKQLAFYSGNIVSGCGGSVDYHPLDHIFAFSFYSTELNFSSIYVMKHSVNCNLNKDVLLYMLQEPTFIKNEFEIMTPTKTAEHHDSANSIQDKKKINKFRITKNKNISNLASSLNQLSENK